MSSLARIRFVCSHCNKKLSVQPAAAGRTLPCPNSECGKPLTVPFDVIEAAEPNGTAVPVNPPGSAAFVTAAKPGAMMMLAAAFSIFSLGVGLSFFLLKAYGGPKKAPNPVERLANVAHGQKAAVKAVPKTRPVTSQTTSPESKRKLAAAKAQESKEAQKEQEARKERDKILSEYAALARAQSFEYYHNDRRVIPRWQRPASEVTMARPLSLARYDDDIPRIRQLVHSKNENIRDIATSIMKSYAMTESYRNDDSVSADNVVAQYNKALTSSESRNLMQDRLAGLGGTPGRSQEQVDAANAKQAFSVYSSVQQQRKANQTYLAALEELAQERKRITYRLAKELAGPLPGKPAGIQLIAEAFVPGEDVFRAASADSPPANATYCITVANAGKKLTHCSVAVIVRREPARRSVDGARPDIGPPFALEEFTEVVLQPDSSRSTPDGVVLYYIGELNAHDRVHFLNLQGHDVSGNLERIGLVVFSDQMTVACDPNPALQEARDKFLTLAASNVDNPRPPHNKTLSRKIPASRRPAGPPSSKRTTAKGTPRRN